MELDCSKEPPEEELYQFTLRFEPTDTVNAGMGSPVQAALLPLFEGALTLIPAQGSQSFWLNAVSNSDLEQPSEEVSEIVTLLPNGIFEIW